MSGELLRVVSLHQAGWEGENAALLEAMEVLETMAGGREVDPLVRAYYGSASIARARMVPDWRKRGWLQRGAAELDGAVQAAPDDAQVRLLRATSLAILPRWAGRMETVREDFDWLVERAEVGGRRTEEEGRGSEGGGPRAQTGEEKERRSEDGEQGKRDLGRGAKSEGKLGDSCRQAIYYHAGSFAMRERDPRAVEWLEAAVQIGKDGDIDMDRLQRVLQLARRHFLSEDGNHDR